MTKQGGFLKTLKYRQWVQKIQANLSFFLIVRANECYKVSLKSQIFAQQKSWQSFTFEGMIFGTKGSNNVYLCINKTNNILQNFRESFRLKQTKSCFANKITT